MSQARSISTNNKYSVAGADLQNNSRFSVSSAILPDVTAKSDDERITFRFDRIASNRSIKIPFLLAAIIILTTLVMTFSFVAEKMDQKLSLIDNIKEIRQKLETDQADCDYKHAVLAKVQDEALICEKAVKKLGMKRVAEETTIQIYAPDTRPIQIMTTGKN